VCPTPGLTQPSLAVRTETDRVTTARHSAVVQATLQLFGAPPQEHLQVCRWVTPSVLVDKTPPPGIAVAPSLPPGSLHSAPQYWCSIRSSPTTKGFKLLSLKGKWYLHPWGCPAEEPEALENAVRWLSQSVLLYLVPFLLPSHHRASPRHMQCLSPSFALLWDGCPSSWSPLWSLRKLVLTPLSCHLSRCLPCA
jgi:hypothetical protein